ncbi:MAG: hypothetical protein AAGC60_26630 [Acidobacteriota bacterium]
MRYFVWLGLALLVSLLINAFRERKINAGSVALWTLGLFYVLDIAGAVVGMAKASGSIPAFEQGAFIGRITGSAIIPLGIAFVIRQQIRQRSGSEDRSSQGEVPNESLREDPS